MGDRVIPPFVPPPRPFSGEAIGDYYYIGSRWFADGPPGQLQPVELGVWAIKVRSRITGDVGVACWTAPTPHNRLGLWSSWHTAVGECRTFCVKINALTGGAEILNADTDSALGGVIHA